MVELDINDVTTDLDSSDQVFAEIPKETVKKLFENAGEIPVNDTGEDDDSYEYGDVQFIFEKGTDNLQEIIIFPVYSDGDEGFVNGEDYIDAPNEIYNNAELITFVTEILNDFRKNGLKSDFWKKDTIFDIDI